MRLPLFTIVAAVLLSACGGSAQQTTPAEEPVQTSEVVLVTHDSFNLSQSVLDDFAADSGLQVRILAGGDAGEMLNQAILTKGNPQGDVLFGVDTTFLSRALEEELFVAYESPALDAVDPDLLPPSTEVTPIDYGDVCINYDRAFYSQRDMPVPETLEQLTRPEYAGQLVVENPATSSPGLAFLLATVARFGEDGWLEYWEALRANDVAVSAGWEDAYYGQFSGAADSPGTRPLVVSYASSPPAEVYYADPQPQEPPTGVLTDSCFRQVEYAGILRGTANEEGARRVIDFLLSEQVQADIPLTMFVFPVRTDVALPEVFTRFAELPDDPLTLPYDVISANREAWIEAWTATVLR